MPLSDGNPFVLARLAPGVAYHGDLKFSRPFDNGGTSDFTADGGPGRNEFTLDGSPNMANGRRGVRSARRCGAGVQGRDRDLRRPAGSHRRRDGQRHAEERHQQDQGRRLLPLPRRGALGNDFSNAQASRRPAWTTSARLQRRRPGARQAYDGRNKTFFFTGWEWLYDTFPEPGQFTVPTEAQRNGDFSALLAGHRHLRSADRSAARRRPHRAPAVPEQRHPVRADQPIAREYEILADAESGGHRHRPQQLHQRRTRAATTSTR